MSVCSGSVVVAATTIGLCHPAHAGFTYIPVPDVAAHATMLNGNVTSGGSGGGEHPVSWEPGIPNTEKRSILEFNIEFLQLLGGQGALGTILSAEFTFDHIQSRVGDSVWHLSGYEGNGSFDLIDDPYEINQLVGRLENYQVGQPASLALDPRLMMTMVGVSSHIGIVVNELTDNASGSFSAGFPAAMAEITFENVYASDGVAWDGPAVSGWDAQASNWTGNALPTVNDHTFIQPDVSSTITAPNASTSVQSLTLGGGAGDATLRLDPVERLTSKRMTTVYANGTIDINGGLLVTDGLNLMDGGSVEWNGGILFVVDDFFSVPEGRFEMDDPDTAALTLMSGATMFKTDSGTIIGKQHNGRFLVTNGSGIFGGYIILGEEATGNGRLTVQDPGTLIQLSALIVGPEGQGTATIEDGARADINFLTIGKPLVGATSNPATGGKLVIRDPGTIAEVTTLGVYGTGTAEILNGVDYTGSGAAITGETASPPQARFSGPGTHAVFTSQIFVGPSGSSVDQRGILRIENQAQLTVEDIVLSFDALSPDTLPEAELYVSGTGTGLTVNDVLIMAGNGGDALVEVSGGAQVEVHGLSIATLQPDAQATILITDPGTQWLQHDSMWIAGVRDLNTQDPVDLGTAQLTIENGAWLIADGEFGVFADASVNLTGGGLSAASILDDRGGAFNFTGGALRVGEYIGDLDNNGGTLASTDAPGLSQVSGDYTQASGGTLRVVLGGPTAGDSFDLFDVAGAAVLDGTLQVLLDGLFVPQLGDSFQFLNASSVTGLFSTELFPALPGGLEFELIGDATSVRLEVVEAVVLAGDLDGDGFVGIDDLTLVLGAWNQNVPPANPLADPSGDGFVGIDDLTLVLGNWNAGTPPTSSSIPEPTSAGLILPALLGLITRARR